MKSFTFYLDYFNLIDTLSNKNDKDKLFSAIVYYVFKDEEPNLKGHNKAIFNTLKHQLDKSKNNSGRGGAPIGNSNAKKGENNKNKLTDLTTEKTTDLITDNKTVSYNKTSILSFKFYISNLYISNLDNKDRIYNLFEEYLTIRNKKKYIVNETIIKRLVNKLNEYGKTDEEKIEIIENAINGAWKDFYELKHKEDDKPKYQQVLEDWLNKGGEEND